MTTLNDLDAIGGGAAKLWVSGETVTQWDYRKSPLDGETYQRKTATGGGTTDPADDVTNYVAKSFTRVTALPNAAVGPLAVGGTASTVFATGAVKPALPVAAVGVRTLCLSLTGRGRLGFLGMHRNGLSTQVEILVDGRSVYNKDIVYTNVANECAVFVGSASSGKLGASDFSLNLPILDHIGLEFKRSLQVYVTGNSTFGLAATDFLAYLMRSEA